MKILSCLDLFLESFVKTSQKLSNLASVLVDSLEWSQKKVATLVLDVWVSRAVCTEFTLKSHHLLLVDLSRKEVSDVNLIHWR